jgi:hypothetical protein
MKLHLMHNKSGKIMAAVRIDKDKSKARHPGQRIASPRPVPKPGFTSVELEVPAEHEHLSFQEVCTQLMVSTSGGKPHLKLRPQPKQRKGSRPYSS